MMEQTVTAIVTNRCSFPMEPQQISLNDHVFTRFECEIACAIQLYIRLANNKIPSDETLACIIRDLRGHINKPIAPTENMVLLLQYHEREDHRAIYLSV